MDARLRDLLRSLRSTSRRIREQLTDWLTRHGNAAPPSASALAALARGVAERIDKEATSLFDNLEKGKHVDDQAVIALNKRTRPVAAIASLLEHCTQHAIHPILSPVLQSVLEHHAIAGQVLVSTTRDVSYELLSITEDQFAGSVETDATRKVRWPILVFRVPHAPADWPLHHVLLFHEFGHALYKAKAATFAPVVPPELDQKRKSATDLFRRIEAARLISIYATVYTSWAEELYSDAVATLVVGPPYLSGFCRVIGGHYDIGSASPSHPPSAYRIGLMGSILEQGDLLEPLPARAREVIKDWMVTSKSITKYKTTRSPELSGLLDILIRELTTKYASIVAAARNHLGVSCCDKSIVAEDIRRGGLLHDLNIPPVEASEIPSCDAPGEPLSPARVFAASWAAYYRSLENDWQTISDGAKDWQLSAALLGALDAADSLRCWRKP